LVVYLKRKPRQDELRELLAVCKRYGVNMRQLAKFETAQNRVWFCDPQKYWHRAVFGPCTRDRKA
jgi:IS30 family transposase